MMHAAVDPSSVNNVWGFLGVAVMAAGAIISPLLVARRDKPAAVPEKAPERVVLEKAYGVPTDDISDMAIRLIFSVRQELQDEKQARQDVQSELARVQGELARVQGRLDRVLGWGAHLIANWRELRQNEEPPEMPRDEPEEER